MTWMLYFCCLSCDTCRENMKSCFQYCSSTLHCQKYVETPLCWHLHVIAEHLISKPLALIFRYDSLCSSRWVLHKSLEPRICSHLASIALARSGTTEIGWYGLARSQRYSSSALCHQLPPGKNISLIAKCLKMYFMGACVKSVFLSTHSQCIFIPVPINRAIWFFF